MKKHCILRENLKDGHGHIGTLLDITTSDLYSRVVKSLTEHYDADVYVDHLELNRCIEEIKGNEDWSEMSVAVDRLGEDPFIIKIQLIETWLY